MIIVEGPDGSGKTTLAKKLCERFELEYRRPPTEVLSSEGGALGPGLIAWWVEQLENPDLKGVYDRCYYISDPIYRPHSGRAPMQEGRAFMQQCQKMHNLVEPLLIFALPPIEVCMANTFDTTEGRPSLQYLDRERAEIVYWQYWCSWTLWGELDYNNTQFYNWDNEAHIIGEVGEYLRRKRSHWVHV